MAVQPHRENRSARRRKERETKWTKGWQDDRKFLSLFYNPGAVFMDCIWLQSAIIRLLVLHENQEQIPEFVKANGVRGGLLPDWYVEALHEYLRTTDMRPAIKKFREAFSDYLSDQTVYDLDAIAFTRNAIGHSYIAAGQHIDRGTRSAATLRYAPRNVSDFDEDTEDVLKEWAIEADEQWMSVHHARMGRLFLVCEAIAERLGVPAGMVY